MLSTRDEGKNEDFIDDESYGRILELASGNDISGLTGGELDALWIYMRAMSIKWSVEGLFSTEIPQNTENKMVQS